MTGNLSHRDELQVLGQRVIFGTSERMEELPSKLASLIVTSPPYWNLKDYKHKDQVGLEDTYEDYLKRMNTVWNECYRISNDNAILAINVRSIRVNKTYLPIAMDVYKNMSEWKLIDHLIWYIPNALPNANYYIERIFDNKYEDVLIFAKNYNYEHTFNKIRIKQKYLDKDPRSEKYNKDGRDIGNIFRIPAYRPPNVKKLNYHQAAFPEELVHIIIHTYSNRRDIIIDPFLGSGTTLKVARILGRTGIGYEINDDLKPLIEKKITEEWSPEAFSKYDLISSSEQKSKPKRRRKKIRSDSTGVKNKLSVK